MRTVGVKLHVEAVYLIQIVKPILHLINYFKVDNSG